jgi:hypothetical protein
MRVALACIAKNEDNYIKEWVDYHVKLGFDQVFIYQNDWRCSIPLDNATPIEFDGPGMQAEAYNNFLKHWYNHYDWVMFLDVDEFLVLKKHKNVKEFIQDYQQHDIIGINWVLFGDSGLNFDGNYSVLNRFTKRQVGVFHLVKCITRVNPNILWDVHNAVYRKAVDTNHKIFGTGINPNGDDTIAQINHYFCKTRDEWFIKKNRGRADVSPNNPDFMRRDSDFDAHNLNHIEDRFALDFYLDKI